MSDGKKDGRPRILLGPIAIAVASEVAAGEPIKQEHLEEAIERLIAQQARTDHHNTALQLQMINENLIRIRHMLAALAANTDEEVQLVLGKLVTGLNKDQINLAEKTRLDVPRLANLHERMLEALALEAQRGTEAPEIDEDLDR